MDIKEAKTKLAELKNINLRINAKREELVKVLESKEFLTKLKLGELQEDLGKQRFAESRAAAESLRGLESRYAVSVERIADELGRLLGEKDKISAILASLPDESERMLSLRYISRKQWLSIARQMHYSERQIYYLHSKALSEFAALYGGCDEKP